MSDESTRRPRGFVMEAGSIVFDTAGRPVGILSKAVFVITSTQDPEGRLATPLSLAPTRRHSAPTTNPVREVHP
jgi:hypothetical protein